MRHKNLSLYKINFLPHLFSYFTHHEKSSSSLLITMIEIDNGEIDEAVCKHQLSFFAVRLLLVKHVIDGSFVSAGCWMMMILFNDLCRSMASRTAETKLLSCERHPFRDPATRTVTCSPRWLPIRECRSPACPCFLRRRANFPCLIGRIDH